MTLARDTRLRCLMFVIAAVGLALVQGCATPGGAPMPERTTESDQSDGDRRARVRLELASAYFGRGQLETALDEVKLSIAASPNFSEAYNLRGLIYASLGDEARADDSFRRALQLNARDADALHNYGWFLCQRQRFGDAATQFELALAQPQYRGVPRTLLARGICQARAGQLLEAEGSLMRAYELDPSNPATAMNLAEVLLRRGEYTRARFYVGRVNAQQAATNAQSLWLAARIEFRLGNSVGARELGEQMRSRFPRAPEVQRFEGGRFDD